MNLLRILQRQTASPEKESKASAYRTCAQLKERWLVPVSQPMLFISEIQRSGGTLLSQLLDGHPECFAHPYEIKWGRPEKWDWPDISATMKSHPLKVFKRIDEKWLETFAQEGYYKKVSGWQDSEEYPFIFDRELQKRLFQGLMEKNPPKSQREVLNYYLSSLFNAWLDYQHLYNRNKKFVTGFTPRVTMYPESLARFFADYPDGYLISLIRHPASWYSSAIKHGYAQYGSIENIMQFWQDSAMASLQAKAQYGDRVIVLLFEDLVCQTEAVMQLICQRTGLSFHQTLLEPTFNGISIHSCSNYEASYQIDQSVVDRYRDVLCASDIEGIEQGYLHTYEKAASLYGIQAASPTVS